MASHAHDSQLRAELWRNELQRIAEEEEGARVNPALRNIALARSLHPSLAGTSSLFTLQRLSPRFRSAIAECGPDDGINRWTDRRVYASTDGPDRS